MGGTWGVMTLQFKTSGCGPCGSFCGLGPAQTNAVLQKKVVPERIETTNPTMNTQTGSPRGKNKRIVMNVHSPQRSFKGIPINNDIKNQRSRGGATSWNGRK